MPRIYTQVRRPVQKLRLVNPLLLPETPAPALTPEPEREPEPSTEMNLAELRGLADMAGVASYGTKADIVARLTDE